MIQSRRNFIKSTSAIATGAVLKPFMFKGKLTPDVMTYPICVFTKCLQFLDYEKLGETLSGIGFVNAELSVRKGGHVLPENIKTDLPKVVKTLHKFGVSAPMMVSDVISSNAPDTEIVLKTAADNGIKYYRMGYLTYDPKITVEKNLDIHKKTFEELETINRKTNIYGCYQNHSGTRIGGPVWDLYSLVKDCDPAFIGIQYDIRHAVVEGGVSWPLGMKLLSPWIKTTVIKDFIWQKEIGKWKITNVPLGEGMVDFETYIEEYKSLGIEGPVTIHYEYDLGGAESGKKNPTMSLDKISVNLKRDLDWLRGKFTEHGLIKNFT